MEYLSKTCPIYVCEKSDMWVTERQHDEVVWDDVIECFVAVDDKRLVMRPEKQRDAVWYAVALYTAYRVYGGPEEGGWWYDCGALIEHHRIKFFDSYSDAQAYADGLWDYALEENKHLADERLVVRCFTEQMPDAVYPKTRPYYS